jgi:type IV pilus assembly protein PilC
MARFKYEATDGKGSIQDGFLEADTRERAVESLGKRNLIPISVEEIDATKNNTRPLLLRSFSGKISTIDQVLFVRNLATAINAGVGIIESLDIQIADTAKGRMRNFLIEARMNMQNGEPLSETFKAHQKQFPSIFVGMLKAGEASGRLGKTLEELGQYLTKEYELNKKTRSALAYPLLLLISTFVVVALMLIFVLPRLTRVFQQSGAKLPWVTSALINLSHVMTYSYILDAIILGLLAWFFIFFRKTGRGKRFFYKVESRIPVVKTLIQRTILVRFTRVLGSLIAGGLPIVESLNLSSNAVDNDDYRDAIQGAASAVANGMFLSDALGKYSGLFPMFFLSLLAVGEKTGTLEHVLKTFADFYDEEVDNALKDLTTFIEPVLILFMGVVIATIAVAILLPIFQLTNKFTG